MDDKKRIGTLLKQYLSTEELIFLAYILKENIKYKKLITDPELYDNILLRKFQQKQISTYLINLEEAIEKILDDLDERTNENIRKELSDLLHKGRNVNE